MCPIGIRIFHWSEFDSSQCVSGRFSVYTLWSPQFPSEAGLSVLSKQDYVPFHTHVALRF